MLARSKASDLGSSSSLATSFVEEIQSEWQIVERAQRALARRHPAYLGEYALGLEPQPFHIEWHNLCRAHKRLILFAPIEHGKSTQMSVLGPLDLLGRNPDLKLGIFSQSAGQAKKWLSLIKVNIESNPRIAAVFPERTYCHICDLFQPGKPPGSCPECGNPWELGAETIPALAREDRRGWPKAWLQDRILVRRTEAAALREKDYSIQAVGLGGRILGTRLDGAILDDCLGPENTTTQAQRQRVKDWFLQQLVGRIEEGGFIWIIGTAWHEEDLAHHLERELGDVFTVKRYRAGTEECSWPDRWPKERLEARRRELGELEYDRQMRNVPLGEASQFFATSAGGAVRKCQELCKDPAEWWAGIERSDARKRFFSIGAGIDLGMSEYKGSPRTAIGVVGLCRERHRHLLHMRSGVWMGAELLRQVADVWHAFHPRGFLFETNAAQMQVAQMMRDREILKALGLSKEDIRGLRVFGQYTTQHNRGHIRWGIRGLAPEFEGFEWRLPGGRDEIEALIDEMRAYTPWDHPGDRLVALWLASLRLKGRGRPLPLKARTIGTKAA